MKKSTLWLVGIVGALGVAAYFLFKPGGALNRPQQRTQQQIGQSGLTLAENAVGNLLRTTGLAQAPNNNLLGVQDTSGFGLGRARNSVQNQAAVINAGSSALSRLIDSLLGRGGGSGPSFGGGGGTGGGVNSNRNSGYGIYNPSTTPSGGSSSTNLPSGIPYNPDTTPITSVPLAPDGTPTQATVADQTYNEQQVTADQISTDSAWNDSASNDWSGG